MGLTRPNGVGEKVSGAPMDAVRPYRPADRTACLALFDGNTPPFFAASERADFAAFLDGAPPGFLVVVRGDRIVGCGGCLVSADGATAGLAWGMVARDLHRSGVGTRLLTARLERLRAMPGLARATLDTSQHTRDFYARFGFRPLGVTPDGYGPGLHRWDMALDLERPTLR